MFDYLMWTYGSEIVTVIITSIFGFLGFVVKNLVKKHLDDATKQKIVKTVVKFVEQCYKELHGREKFDVALLRATELLNEKGIKCTSLELETLIEAAVAEFNEAFKNN